MKCYYKLRLYPSYSRSNQKLPYRFLVCLNTYSSTVFPIPNSESYVIPFDKGIEHRFLFKSRQGVVDAIDSRQLAKTYMNNNFGLTTMLTFYNVQRFLTRLSTFKEYSYGCVECVTDNFQTIELLLKTIPIYFHPKMRKYALSPKSLQSWKEAIKPIINDIKVS